MSLPVIRGIIFLFSLILPFAVQTCEAQPKIIKGYIKDALSDERIPFASIQFVKAQTGRLSDSAGNFVFRFDNWPDDTLLVTYVGYQDYKLFIGAELPRVQNDTLNVVVRLERGKYASEVIVNRTVDRGLLMWRRIVRRKAFNDKFR